MTNSVFGEYLNIFNYLVDWHVMEPIAFFLLVDYAKGVGGADLMLSS
jgi:hypothetical protein